ncbi:hypothetical protein BOX15_Mlig021022g3 [Macrostomum lignano]|uniref:B box-type domain-containing protein n=1 Tax=Macrostomum lignano TaxID=282301 RepID=A0A267FSH1_9PLAT|nr:hypothetical protein BOX15_Mlig021022g3 [Macrostomum lignano]
MSDINNSHGVGEDLYSGGAFGIVSSGGGSAAAAQLFPLVDDGRGGGEDFLTQQQQQQLFLDTGLSGLSLGSEKSFAQQQPQMSSSSSSAQPSAQAIGSSRFLSLGLQLHDNYSSASPAGVSNGTDFLLPPAASPFWSDAASPTRQPLTNGTVGGLRSPSSVAGFGGGGGYSSCCHCRASCSTQSVCPSCRERVCPDCVGSGRHSSLCSGPVAATSSRLVPLAAAAAAAAAPSPTPPSAAGPGSPSAGASKRPLLPPWSRQVGGAGQPAVSGAIERLEQKENSVAAQYDEVAQRVRAHFRQLRDLVAERESQLASALLQVKTLKLATLQEQRAALMEAGAGADLTYLLQPWEDERLFSVQPPLDLARLVRTSCAVYSSACAQFCRLALANGDKAFVGKPFAFRLLVFDHLRQPCTVSANEIDLHLRLDCADAAALNPYGQVQPLSFPGQYQVTLVPERPGRITVNLRLRGRHVPGSPFVLPALEARDYAQLGSDVRVIGRQGDGDLEFNRPWGICADNADNLVIADRSNNQIKIVHSSGSFLRKFGQRGEGPGEFNRPAGVCLGSDKRIYVADKDNHRVQVFTWTGQFIRVFGKQGKGPGEFNYPWDLAVGKAGRLAVADSRNHRIQLFSEDGDYVTEFSIARSPGFAGIKSFDCRGASCSPPLASCCAPTSICIASW